MNEGKLTFVYRYQPRPGQLIYVRELGTGICCQHEDPSIALKDFDSIWAGRSPYSLVDRAPPQMKSPGSAAPQGDKLIEHDAIPFKLLARAFHPDLLGKKRKFSADEIMQVINGLRDATRAGNG